jgi:hypothetical protein
MRIRRIAGHWPVAAIVIGTLLTLAWIGFLVWLVASAIQAVF